MDVVQLSVVGHANRALAVSPAFTWILKCIDPTLFGELREMQQLPEAFPVGTLKKAKRKKRMCLLLEALGFSPEEAPSQPESLSQGMTKHCGSKVNTLWGITEGRAFPRQRIFQKWPCQWGAAGKSNSIHSKDELESYWKGKVKRGSGAATKKRRRCEFWKGSTEGRSCIFHHVLILLCVLLCQK